MKKLLVLIAIVILGMTATAQTDSAVTFDYGIELANDTVFRSNNQAIVHYVKTFPPRFLNTKVVFYFDTESINITTGNPIDKRNQIEVVLKQTELQYDLFGTPVYKWLEGLTSPNPAQPDSLVIRYIGQLVYDYKVMGGN